MGILGNISIDKRNVSKLHVDIRKVLRQLYNTNRLGNI